MKKYKHNVFKEVYPEHIVDITPTYIFGGMALIPVNVMANGIIAPLNLIEGRNYQEK